MRQAHIKKKIYIAGPMTGVDEWNFPAFDAAEKRLERWWNVISPVAMDRLYEGWDGPPSSGIDNKTRERCMRRDIDAIFWCDAMYMLEGWRQSKGARLEHALAEFLEIEIFYGDSMNLTQCKECREPTAIVYQFKGYVKCPSCLEL